MRRVIWSLLAACLIATACSFGVFAADEVFRATYVNSELGMGESWPLALAQPIEIVRHFEMQGAVTSDPDLASARVWGFFDDRYLYLYAEVKDATPLRNNQPLESMFLGDGLEISFAAAPGQRIKYIIGVLADGVAVDTRPKSPAESAQVAIQVNGDGTGYTFKGKFDTEHPTEFAFLDLKEVSELPFEFWVNDSENGMEKARTIIWQAHVNQVATHGKMLLVRE